jgi:hypothetical protein
VNEADRIARFTVLIRPISGLYKLAESIAHRMREGSPARR